MIISTNWLRQFTDIDGTIDELSALIGARLVEIERVVELGRKYDGVVVAKVIDCVPVENSDHLNVTKIDDGGVTQDVERDDKGLVQVVCGAPNVRAGIMVAWLPPGSTVPDSFGDKEPFVLGARKLRGVLSNGMLASAKELDLFDSHDGILIVDKDAAPGTPFAEVYGLNDYLLDIENKSLTHRPDTFGVIGFAREVAAIQGKSFKTPDWLAQVSGEYSIDQPTIDTPTVTIESVELSARYQAVVMTGVDALAESPLQIQTELARVGVRPISAVVDVTNYLMMLTGQPLHAFDYDKLIALNNGVADIRVRAGRPHETLELLDGRTIELTPNDIVVANGTTAIALAGAMGGAATEIDSTTKNVIVESATFNLYNLRNTQMRHGIFSEAITRFTKGQPAALTAPVLAAAVRLMQTSANATQASNVADSVSTDDKPANITVAMTRINESLGAKFSIADIVDTLQNVEFIVAVNDTADAITVTAPYWRSDIHIAEDIIEEVGRLNGFDAIEPTLPTRDFTAVAPIDFDILRNEIRKILVRSGANEVLSYSFVHGDVLSNAGQKTEDSYKITNSLSPDLQYYRQSLTPSLLSNVHGNIKSGYDRFALFEMNKAHNKIHGLNEEGVPAELNFLALTMADSSHQKSAPYYQAKQYLEFLGESLGLSFVYSPLDSDPGYPVTSSFEYRRSALVTDDASGEFIGIVGEYKTSVRRAFKLPEFSAGFEIGPEALLKAVAGQGESYVPTSKYPAVNRDICFQVTSDTRYATILAAANDATSSIDCGVAFRPLDIYHAQDSETKNITIRVTLQSDDRTLTGEDAKIAINAVVDSVSLATGATVV